MRSALCDIELDDVRDIDEFLAKLVERLDPDAIATCDARPMWTTFVSISQRAMSAATLMARRFEDARGTRPDGSRSAADAMSKIAGTSTSEAKRMLQTSKKVKRLPKTADKMRKGKLSPAKAEAIADAASEVPEAEDELLDGAEAKTIADVRDECLKVKATSNPDDRHARIHRDRRLTQYTDKEGAWNLYPRAGRRAGRVQGRARTNPGRAVQASPGQGRARTT
jgi:hypothetical protein